MRGREREKAFDTRMHLLLCHQKRNSQISYFALYLIITTSLVANQAIVRLLEWLGIPPKDYNGNLAKRFLEWPYIPPKAYEGEVT